MNWFQKFVLKTANVPIKTINILGKIFLASYPTKFTPFPEVLSQFDNHNIHSGKIRVKVNFILAMLVRVAH